MRQLILLLVALLLLPLSALAQQPDPDPNTEQSTLTGSLSASQPRFEHHFEAQAGDRVQISARSSEFDTLLYLTDAAGRELARNDDHDGSLNARIEWVALPDDGTYTVVVDTAVEGETGDFSLTLELNPLQSLQLNESVSGEISPQRSIHYYHYSAQAGEMVFFRVSSPYYPPSLTIYDLSSNRWLMGVTSEARYPVSSSGPWYFADDQELIIHVAKPANAEGQGSFTLEALKVEPILMDGSDSHKGLLTNENPVGVYLLPLEIWDRLSAWVESDSDLTLSLYNPDLRRLYWDDDGGTGSNPMLEGFVASELGTFALVIHPHHPTDLSEPVPFTLQLAHERPRPITEGAYEFPLDAKRSPQYLALEVNAGDIITITGSIEPSPTHELTIALLADGRSAGRASEATAGTPGLVTMTYEADHSTTLYIHVSRSTFLPAPVHLTIERGMRQGMG